MFARLSEKIRRPGNSQNIGWWALLMVISFVALVVTHRNLGPLVLIPLFVPFIYILSRFSPPLAALLGGITALLVIIYIRFICGFGDEAVGIVFVGIFLISPLSLAVADLGGTASSYSRILILVAIVVNWALYGALASIAARRLKKQKIIKRGQLS